MILERLDEDEKAKLDLGLSGGATNVINEFGLHSLILRSDKSESRPFRRWITHEVLPAIRKTGGYGIPNMIFMQDKRLTLQAKAIFMYLLTCSDGQNPFSVPPCSEITAALGIGSDQYRRHFNILKEFGYICSERTRRPDGKLGRTMITINEVPPLEENKKYIGEENDL